ncbi:MAG: thioredoxin TrxC [Rhodospirillales bacterium]|nr:thioredoxin TrxC [Rhodospirillales bacterium]
MAEVLQLVCPHCGAVNRVPRERPAMAAKCGGCHERLFDGKPAEVDAAGFERHVRSNDIPVLVDVWAPWCGPCKMMAPSFTRAAAALEPQVRLIKLNADTAPEITTRLGVRGIPALFLLQRGRELGQTAGAMDAQTLIRWTREHLPASQN